jgi:hypothetical protein
LNNTATSSQPAICKSHRKQLFCDWLVKYFLPEMKKYCAEENPDFTNILILDNTSTHVLDYVSLYENMKIIYMLLRTIQVMQPTDQEVICALNM